MPRSRQNAVIAILFYVFWILTSILGTLYCFSRGYGFHIVLFATFITVYMIGGIAASRVIPKIKSSVEKQIAVWEFGVGLEMIAIRVSLSFGTLCFIAMFYLINRMPLYWLIMVWIIILFHQCWFLFRLRCLRLLKKDLDSLVEKRGGNQ